VIWRVTATQGRTRGRQHDLEPVVRLAEALAFTRMLKHTFIRREIVGEINSIHQA
jgi:hypothetical protein